MNRSRRHPFLPALFALSAALPLAALSDTATWIGGTGNWTDAANWSPEAVPNDAAEADPRTDVLIDGNAGTESTVTWSLTTSDVSDHYLGNLTISEGDSLTFTGKPGGSGSTYSRLRLGQLSNSGSLTMNGPSASKTHGNEFLLSIGGPVDAPFNTATGQLVFKSISNYRRCHNFVDLPGIAQNDGYFWVESRMTQNAGHVTVRFYSPGDEMVFTNNGNVFLVGKGDGDSWVTFSPLLTNHVFTLAGTGTVHLASATGAGNDNYRARAMIAAIAPGIPFIHASSHTIVGCGDIGRSGAGGNSNGQGKIGVQHFQSVINEGTILAQRYISETEELRSTISDLSITAGSGMVSNAPTGKIVIGTPTEGAAVAIGAASGSFINAGLLEIAAGSTCSNACTTTLADSSVLRFGINASVTSVEDFEEIHAQWEEAQSAPSEEPGEEPVEEPENPEPEPILRSILDVSNALVFGGRIELAEGSRPQIGATYRLATCNPGQLTTTQYTIVRTSSLPAFALRIDSVAGTVDAYFPPPETVILIQ